MSKIKIGAQVTAKVRPTKVTVSGTFQGYRLEDQEDPTSICGTVLHVKDGMQHLDYVYVDSIKVCESEDERIYNLIYSSIKNEMPIASPRNKELAIAYLEKHKEQRSIEDVIKNITKNKEVATKFLKSAGIMDDNGELSEMYRSEQKPAEWSEEEREEDLRTRFAFYTYKDEEDVLYLSNVFVEKTSRNKGFGTKILAAAEKVAETIGAINIRLKAKKDSPANSWYRRHGYGYMTFEGDYDWLEKTLEHMKPKQEQPEVDLEKIIGQTYHDGSVADTSDMDLVDYENIARHFYELARQKYEK